MTSAPAGGDEGRLAPVRALARARTGARVVRVEPLAGGLGTRRFLRLALDGPPWTLVARLEAPEDPAGRPAGTAPEPPLEPLRSVLETAGLPVPASLGSDPARGIDLLEDLGDRTLADAVAGASRAERRRRYREACDLVPRLQAVADPGELPAFRRRLDARLLAYKADLFLAHSAPLALGRPATAAEARCVREAFAAVATVVAEAPARLAHRDLQSHNLLERPTSGELVAIDLQGAFLAPPEYDLVCLLRDSYVELPAEEVAAQLERVRPALPDAPDPARFARRFHLLTLTRKAKDHARFADLAGRRGLAGLRAHLPATVRALHAAAREAAGEPGLAPLCEIVRALPETALVRALPEAGGGTAGSAPCAR